jgi:hypothetical protein
MSRPVFTGNTVGRDQVAISSRLSPVQNNKEAIFMPIEEAWAYPVYAIEWYEHFILAGRTKWINSARRLLGNRQICGAFDISGRIILSRGRVDCFTNNDYST